MNHLLREMAPVSEAAWGEIEEEATSTLKHFLAGRRLLELSGPHGYEHSAVSKGRVEQVAKEGGATVSVRQVLPVVELRTPFRVGRDVLESIDRGAVDPELDPVKDAARAAALLEDRALFHGLASAGVKGISEASPHSPIPISDDYHEYPSLVARAVAQLREAGVGGPYGIALGPRCHTGVIESTERGGYPVLEHIRLVLDGPVVWAPGVDGAVVVSLRGGDYQISCGEDFSIGYVSHDADGVDLYIEETFAFRIDSSEAGVALTYQAARSGGGSRRGGTR